MHNRKSTYIIRLIAVLLILCLIMPMSAMAAVADPIQPMASDYLNTYRAYMNNVGGGDVQVWFRVLGTQTMDVIGAESITIEYSPNNSDWISLGELTPSNTSGLVTYNAQTYTSYVDYSGVVGFYYRAKVSVYAEKNGGSDSREIYTEVIRATAQP